MMFRSSLCESLGSFCFRNKPCQLPFMRVIFSATKGLYNISGLFVIFKCPANLLGTCLGFFIDRHNAQFHCSRGKWHDRRHFICDSFWVKKILYPVTRHKIMILSIFRRGCRIMTPSFSLQESRVFLSLPASLAVDLWM